MLIFFINIFLTNHKVLSSSIIMCGFCILLSQMVFSKIFKNHKLVAFYMEDTKPNNYLALNTSLGNIMSDESLKRVSGTDLFSKAP